jgi:AraC family transcriptional regulator
MSATNELVTQLLPVLVQIQARLDEDLALPRLARLAGMSQFHFLRQFRALTGETPKQYVLRLRVERAALRLLLLRSSVLDVALDCGFRSHETFTRAFRRRFGTSPRDYRESRAHVERPPAIAAEEQGTGCAVSRTKIVELEDMRVAFVRHVGPYEQVPADLWDGLVVRSRGPSVLLGIVHDAPGITPPERCRFDAAVKVSEGWTRAARAGIGIQLIPGGTFAITTHIGPYRTLGEAYHLAFQRIARMKRYQPAGLPCLEVYSATTIDPAHELNQTDLCLRLSARSSPLGG